jgi:DNA-binding transcriptional ArsR family regulator
MPTVFQALAHPTRRQILALLREQPRTAGELAEAFSVSKPTLSAHFSTLREAGLVASEKRGRTVVYQLQVSVLEDALLRLAQSVGLELQAPSADPSPDAPESAS